MNKKILLLLVAMILVLAACAPAATAQDTMMEEPTAVMTEDHSADMAESSEAMDDKSDDMATEEAEMMDDVSDDAMITPTWFEVSLNNVNTGEFFKISDFSGKVVLVENLAMWCSTCKKQQNEIVKLRENLGKESDLVTVGLDVDPNEEAGDLQAYTTANNFDWYYAIAPQEVTNEISNLYGAQYLNPPSAPILLIDREGNVHTLPFGLKSAEELMEFIQPFLSEDT
jgi:thiol-disulfide isomerase/thioredoxin